ncbi:DNA-dependent metalloprotease SPRTN isoform X2 [Anarrhichthys ocellatus]|uniref:DNA-dependent metalloprotease SPRTN isoform X2 n=1 Tax=Anarrhichthys ocellatus TaxID=433405 RepID=UPI0012EDF177|nr:sprT-like domain-containing protein Spartan isoform X2 [Anarrhichthys ocellatus]
MDDDFLLAIRLQEQFDNEYETSSHSSNSFEENGFGHSSKKRRVEVARGGSDVVPYWKPTAQPERPLSIVDASWETLDPSPDVRAMFLEFNDVFFWGKLCGVEVKWSPRMTLCAGVCSYEGRGGLCSIRLSEPLLKLRPRKDLVQTLLHEMIHALLFVTQNNRDRDGHGPEFCKHMNRINDASGTKISVYHSFHDEVDVYRQHWWKCNGPCQNRKPYFGFVKRAMNRAPSAQDPWWEDHKRTCGGTYTKVKEPEGYGKKGKKDGKTSEKKASGKEKPSSTTTGSGSQDIRNMIPFSGKGFLLGGNSQSSTSSSPSHTAVVPSSPKKLFTPPTLAKSLKSPDNKGISSAFPSIRPAPSNRPKPPIKRSVGNTRAFININGSPVKIPKPHSSSRSQEGDKIKQRSIEELFNSKSIRRSASQSSTSSTETKRDSLTSPNITMSASASSIFPKWQNSHSASSPTTSEPSEGKPNHSVVSTKTKGSPATPTQSKYFSHSDSDSTSGASAAGQASRKRTWDDHRSSSSIIDFFQKTVGSDSAASRDKELPRPPHPRLPPPSIPLQGCLVSPPSSSSSSSSALTVSCPVCQAKVAESKINEHLDSCLS